MPDTLTAILDVCEGDDSTFRSETQCALRALVGCDEAHLVTFDALFHQTAPAYMKAFAENPSYSQPLLAAIHHKRCAGSYIDTAVLSATERDEIAFYREVMKPMAMSSQVVQLVRFRGRTLGVLHCNRLGKHASALDETAIALLREPLRLVATIIAARSSSAEVPASLGLTPKEALVAHLAARGYENIQIAAHVGRSVNTVRNQLHSTFRKLGIYSRVDLANAVLGRDGMRIDPRVSAVKADVARLDAF